jgi:hypothetical protein
LWLLIILAFGLYVAADAAFDVSKKISAFVRLKAFPVIRGAWGAVVGVARKRAAPAAPAPSHDDFWQVDHSDAISASDQTRPNNPMRLPSIASVFDWFWKWKAPILIVSAGLFVFGLLRGCSLPFFKSRDTLQAELKVERANLAVAEHERALTELAGSIALETERDAARVDRVIAEAEQEIADAVEADDFDRLYRAYELGLCGVLNYAECADRSDSDPRRAAPVPGPRALGA